MIRTILHYPDPRLREEAKEIDKVDDELRALIEDMAETMYAAPGVGLAAPQIGVGKRLFIIDIADEDEYKAFLPTATGSEIDRPGNWWQPAVGTTWQWQLSGPAIDSSFDVNTYDIDLFDNQASTVAALQAQGHKVICYLSAGSWEDWRPDADQFRSGARMVTLPILRIS